MKPVTLARAIYGDLRGERTTPRSDKEHLSATINWLYRSQDVTGCGGSAAYYSLLTGWSGPYPETSGYIVPTLYDYAEYADSREAQHRAERMVSWLLKVQFNNGAFPRGVDPGPNVDPSVFNTGQVLFGLVRAYRETRDQKFHEAIERAGRWLVDVQHEDGYWDQFDYRGEVHSYCSRVAWALLEAADAVGNEMFREHAARHLQWVVSMQTDTNWFKLTGFSPKETPFLHTIAYTVRGLLEGGLLLEDNRLVATARETADVLLNLQRTTGPLRGAYNESWTGDDFFCLTGNAQMALVWLRLAEQFDDQRYRKGAASAIEFLKRHQLLNAPPEVKGGMKGSLPVWGRYMRLRYPNWAAKFLADCLIREVYFDSGVN
ncbi:prenyltransferase/squalene oxidase repeat-containing protein [Halorarum salinum]|uniref:Squalene cyclase C-terminal domain-containing protein n=1 Tax=Halorarum salinum TaxID=2743089 RepID=A0A7D5L9H7_9EURY|nr:hypothetical protein [Halobaculum salinum]QLG61091.1 hypothetical protein HUG12_04810 [Halobaculum salinum]